MKTDPAIYVLDARPASAHFPGIGRYVSQLAVHLRPLLTANERLLLLHNPQTAGDWPLPPPDERIGWVETAVSPFSLAQQWQIPRLLRQLNTAVYHSTYFLMPYRTGVPTLLTLYDLIPIQFPRHVSRRARLLFQFTNRLALAAADHFLAISQATRQEFLVRCRLAPQKITAVPLAADSRFQPQPPEVVATLRHKLALPPNYLLYLGINKPHKNLLRLVEAWGTVAANQPNAPTLVVAGAWDARYEEVKTAAAHHALRPHIRFLGPVAEADLPALYSGARLFVFPSLVEGFGLPVLEAMACGTAVACARSSSLPEVGGEAAAYFDPHSSKQIATVLADLWPDAERLSAMVQRGFKQVEKFSWQETAVATLTHYRKLAAD